MDRCMERWKDGDMDGKMGREIDERSIDREMETLINGFRCGEMEIWNDGLRD